MLGVVTKPYPTFIPGVQVATFVLSAELTFPEFETGESVGWDDGEPDVENGIDDVAWEDGELDVENGIDDVVSRTDVAVVVWEPPDRKRSNNRNVTVDHTRIVKATTWNAEHHNTSIYVDPETDASIDRTKYHTDARMVDDGQPIDRVNFL